MQKILFSHTFLKKKHYLFCNLFWSSFFTIFFAIFSCIGLIIFKIIQKMTKTCVSELCLHVYYSRNYRNLFRKCEMPRWCIICWNHLADSKSLHYFLSNFHTKGPSGHLASRVFSSLPIASSIFFLTDSIERKFEKPKSWDKFLFRIFKNFEIHRVVIPVECFFAEITIWWRRNFQNILDFAPK